MDKRFENVAVSAILGGNDGKMWNDKGVLYRSKENPLDAKRYGVIAFHNRD